MAKAKEKKSYLAIGKIVAPHGIRGEVKIEPMTDFPERFQANGQVFLGLQTGVTEVAPVTIATARPHQGRWLVQFSHIKDRNAAETLRDQYVLIPEESAMPLGEHENYAHDLIGLDVVTTEGQPLGKLVEILFTPANDVYITRGEGGETLIPATREVILSVELTARRMTVALPEGLLAPETDEDETE